MCWQDKGLCLGTYATLLAVSGARRGVGAFFAGRILGRLRVLGLGLGG
jgi:hypothetical protein